MKRRGIIGALMAVVANLKGQEFTLTDIKPSTTLLRLDAGQETTVGLEVHYKGRIATISMDEIMDALEAKPAKK